MIAALVLAAALNPAFELELAGGVAHPLEPGWGATYDYPFARAAVQGRAAVDFAPGFAVGGMFLAVLGGEAENRADPGCCGSSLGHQAFKAVATLATLRLRSSGPVQFWAEGGAGVGHLISLQTDNSFEHPPLRGTAGPAFRAAAGVRGFVARQVPVGAELAWVHWTHVEQGPNAGDTVRPASYGLSTSALLLLVSVGFTVGR